MYIDVINMRKWTELFLSMHQKYVPLHFENAI